MKTTIGNRASIADGVRCLANHLLRAGRAHKAAVVFAITRSQTVRAEVESQLEAVLRDAGETIVRVHVQPDSATEDLLLYLRRHPQSGRAIFFVYDVEQGGEATERYLNYRREFLVEDRQRLLIWMEESQAAQLARHAPDFCAFRGRALEFLDEPEQQAQETGSAGSIPFFNWEEAGPQPEASLEAGIRLRQTLLAELPDEPAYAANRAELLTTLASYYILAGQPRASLSLFDEAASLAQVAMPERLPSIVCGQGSAFIALDQYEEALAAYDRLLQLAPDDATAHYNRGHTLQALGRQDEAADAYERALALDHS
jgi:tetratricopeptide (TPR) repeat protein